MISFDDFHLRQDAPIYSQILLFLKQGMAAGRIPDGAELPSRRVLSALLGVNPNTVQKAYHLLEEEGLIHSQMGAKSCISLSEERLNKIREELLEQQIRTSIHGLRQMGLGKAEALSLLEKYWD